MSRIGKQPVAVPAGVEFKLDGDDSALSQIREKEYYKRYELSRKKIFLIVQAVLCWGNA